MPNPKKKMTIYHSVEDIEYYKDTVLTVGTFDGVHLGHQHVIRRLTDISVDENLRNIIITFEPHPQIVLQKQDRKPVKLLTTIDERLSLFDRFGVHNILVVRFTKEFSEIPPDLFICDFLWKKIGIRKVLIGYDHLFGKDREGNELLLKSLGEELGFNIEKIDALEKNDSIISSTKIRNSIIDKDLGSARKMLGFYYFVTGTVVHGLGRGRQIGYPTANIDIKDDNKLIPPNGVYLVSSVIDDKLCYGMANIGFRPTFDNNHVKTLEVYYFDFTKDIYDYELSVSFIKFLRDEVKFPGVRELLEQLKNDEKECRENIPELSEK